MSVQLFLAPAGGGKTAHAIVLVRALRSADPLAPVQVVVPNFSQMTAFRRRLAQAGGGLGVEVGTFHRLYADILARAGTPAPRLFNPVQHRLLRAIVDRSCEEGRLRHYAPLRDKPGFVRALRTLIQELERACVHRDDFTAALADQPPRLAELATIYAAYQDWLVTSGWTDAEGQGWLAAQALERDPALYADLALLVVDGFDEFNPTQLEVLRLLARRAAETVITLTGDASTELSTGASIELGTGASPGLTEGTVDPGRTAHRRFIRARAALTTIFPNLKPETLKPETIEPGPPLRTLERRLFEPLAEDRPPADGAVAFIEAQDRRQEVRAAMRWLKTCIVRDGVDPRDVALLARDLGPYLPFLDETAVEFGLPLHLAVGADLLSDPAVAAVLSILSLSALDWPSRLVIETLTSPYLYWSAVLGDGVPQVHISDPTSPGPVDEEGCLPVAREVGARLGAWLDVVARSGLVVQGLDQWREALDRLAEPKPAGDASKGMGAAGEEEGVAPAELPTPEEAAALRRAFERFVERLTPEPRATVRDYVAWVEGLIGEDPKLAPESVSVEEDDLLLGRSLRVVDRVREAQEGTGGHPLAQRDVAALQTFKDALRGLVLSESLLASYPFAGESPGHKVPYFRFFTEVRGAVEASGYKLPPPEQGGILVAPVLGARGLLFCAVALLGISEGEFPAAEREDPLLREKDRALLRERGLALESRLQGEEVTRFYQAITRARERLLLCRPYLADDGQAWEPSPYWQHLQRVVDAPVPRIRPAEVGLGDAASRQEFLSAAAQAGVAAMPSEDQGPVGEEWKIALAGAEVVRARLADPPGDIHEGDLHVLAPLLSRRYGSAHVWSSSRLETYAKCPLHFYIATVLRLEPRTLPQEGFDRLVLGSIYHQVLEEVYRRAPSDPLPALPQVAQSVFRSAPATHRFRPTPLWEQQQKEFLRVLEKTVVALEEARDVYEPCAQELAFGLRGNPTLNLQLPESSTERPVSSIQIRGYVDRVDRAPDGSLRVIDYKAGSSRISARELEEGTRLQLPLYAQAVQEALGIGPVTEGFYWHIGSASPSYLRLGRHEGGVEGAITGTIEHVLAYVAAVREGRFAPTPPASGCPGHCPAIGFCWRYVARGW
jgi:superfamily I DNA/RNA helicase